MPQNSAAQTMNLFNVWRKDECMKTILLSLFAIILFAGCLGSDYYSYKGIDLPKASVPPHCSGKTDCDMFSCMVDMCFCASSPQGGVLYSTKTYVGGTDGAISAAKAYLDANSIPYKGTMRAVKLNALFYNVFYEDAYNDEQTLTVGIDGTIMKTVCGV